MQTIAIKCSDSAYEHVLYLLKNLPKSDILDIKISSVAADTQNPPKAKIDFSAFKVDSFKGIDPVEHQRQIRDEW